MDTSKKYIEMCSKAGEIQKTWHSELGDVFHVSRGTFDDGLHHAEEGMTTLVIQRGSPDASIDHSISGNEYVWMPRQDQLQALIPHIPPGPDQMLYLLQAECGYIGRNFGEEWKKYTSMEQLWLGLVMRMRCKSTWDPKVNRWVPLEKNNYEN